MNYTAITFYSLLLGMLITIYQWMEGIPHKKQSEQSGEYLSLRIIFMALIVLCGSMLLSEIK